MDGFMTLGDAAVRLGVSRMTIWRMTQDGRLTTYHSEANRRIRLVKRAEVEALITPRSIAPAEKKAAA